MRGIRDDEPPAHMVREDDTAPELRRTADAEVELRARRATAEPQLERSRIAEHVDTRRAGIRAALQRAGRQLLGRGDGADEDAGEHDEDRERGYGATAARAARDGTGAAGTLDEAVGPPGQHDGD